MKVENGNFYFPSDDGTWVSQKQVRVAELLKEYDPYLELQWIPPGERSPDGFDFRVIARYPGKPAYLVCVAHECDERLLARVIQCDQRNGNTLDYLEAHNAALDAMKLKERQEQQMEWHDLAASAIRNRKSSYKHGGVDFESPRRY